MNTRAPRQTKLVPKIANERLVIKGGQIANDDQTYKADIFIENGVIKQIGCDLQLPGGITTVDATGSYVIPGGVDASVNLSCDITDSITSEDDFYTGTRAALAGGTTTIVDFVPACSPEQLLNNFQQRCDVTKTSCCDHSLIVDLPPVFDEVVMGSMTSLSEDHGVNCFRVFTCGENQMDDKTLFEVFQHIRSVGCIAMVHAENGSIISKKEDLYRSKNLKNPKYILEVRNEQMEAEAVNRVIVIANEAECPLFIWNVTGEPALKVISDARLRGCQVYAQVHAVSLVQNGSSYKQSSWNKSASNVTHPPLRDDPKIQQKLLNALTSGTLQLVSSGHFTVSTLDKAKAGKQDFSKIPPGTNGIFERMMALWSVGVQTGSLDVNDFVNMTSSAACKILGVYPKKGKIQVGSDADIVVWKTDSERHLAVESSRLEIQHSNVANSFESVESDAGPSVVISRGKIMYADDQIQAVQSHGNFVSLPCFPPKVYDKLQRKNYSPPDVSVVNIDQSDNNNKQQHQPVERITVKSADSSRYTRNSGHRAMHQSGWSFSGDQKDDRTPNKSMIRCYKPPGGGSQIKLN